jgi:antitoxin component YwqK of YwqJK toxin-antitoxin module
VKAKILLITFLISASSMYGQISVSEFMSQFPDSGQYVTGSTIIKNGVWVEYSIDSSLSRTTATFANSGRSMVFGFSFVKKTGSYSNGKKNGLWTAYSSSNFDNNVSWERKSTTFYKDDLKDGEEIFYQGFGEFQKPLIIQHYRNGIEDGKGMIYDLNYPYLLKTSYFVSNGLLNGSYKYYHSNGQLWTELIFSNGKEMEVVSNYDRNGKAQQKGTLKDGNGTVILYDEDGKQTQILEFKDGVEVKK